MRSKPDEGRATGPKRSPAERRVCGAVHLRQQAQWCDRLGSPLYARILEEAAADCEAGGAAWAILDGHEDDPTGSALALRFLGAIHRVVLEGHAPAVARHYASAGETTDPASAWPDVRELLEAERETIRQLVDRPVQTNEVGRSAALLGGFLSIARAFDLPLRLLEIGTSAGLNLRWDHYRYESAAGAWGDPRAAIRFENVFEDAAPPLDTRVAIIERRGCDASPLDPSSAKDRLTLRSYVWADQRERRARLDAALEIAARVPAAIERADAREWLERTLASPARGTATVVFHSIVLQYLGRGGAERVAEILADAGRRATADAPLAWLRLEPAPMDDGTLGFEVRLATWPDGNEARLAISSPHGPPVRWLSERGGD